VTQSEYPGPAAGPAPDARLSRAEQERRHGLLQELLHAHDLDALIVAANDYRGHKGTLRWVTDYNLDHRHGFAFVAAGREPELVLPLNLAHNVAAQGWRTPARYGRRAVEAIVEAVAELPSAGRIGIVGRAEIMRVADAELLGDALPQSELVDVTAAFEAMRAVKSAEELDGVREATRIAERCFERLLEIARPGMTEREVGAEMYRVMYLLGGEDPLFLSMSGERLPDGTTAVRWNAPRDRVLGAGDDFTFSFELIGPLGYWMEFARTVVFGTPSETQSRLNRAVAAGMSAAAEQMRPGTQPASVQAAMLRGVQAHGATSAYWSGHGLGQDVIEEPWIGREVVDEAGPGALVLAQDMVLAMHPMVEDSARHGMAYMANSYIVTPSGGHAVSSIPLDLFVL
jgi:Xaa-Pro dipeptidase